MTLPELSLRRPVLATVLSLLILLIGAAAVTRLPVRELPDVDAAQVTVWVNYAGAAPEVVDAQITTVIEGAVSGIAGLVTMESEAERGRSRTVLEFDSSRDIEDSVNDVRSAIDRVVASLPDGASVPRIRKHDDEADPVIRLGLASNIYTPLELSDYADRFIVDRLARLSGVSDVSIYGTRSPAMRVWLDTGAMAAHGVTTTNVIAALRANNVELPAGEIETGLRHLQIVSRTRLSTPEDFAALPLSEGGARPVLLGDVARIEVGPESQTSLFRTNFQNSVGLGVQRQSQANTVAISQAVRAEVEAISRQLPEGIELSVSTDEALFIEASIREVGKVFIEAVLLVTAVIFLFLGSARAALVPVVTIPISIVGAAIGMQALGYSLNLLSLFALILAIGLVVDDAIVVLENIQRRMGLGEPRAEAARNGANQVNFAVVATTAVLIAVFLPVSFMGGEVGRLFSEFGVVLALAVGVSGLVALTLSPVLAARLLRAADHPGRLERITTGLMRRVERGYAAVLRRVLDHPVPILSLTALFIGASYTVYEALPRELTPQEDRGHVIIDMVGPQGASLETSNAVARSGEAAIVPLVESGIVTNVTTMVGNWGELRRARIHITLVPWQERDRSVYDVVASLRPALEGITSVRVSVRPGGGLGLSRGRGGIDFMLGAPDIERAAEWGQALAEKMEAHPGLANAQVSYSADQPGAAISFDRARARDLGLDAETVAETLQTLFASRNVGEFSADGRQYPVVLQARGEDRDSLDDLDGILMRNARGDLVPVSNFASVELEATSPAIDRFDRIPSVSISADLVGGQDLGEAIAFVEREVSALPVGAAIGWESQARHFLATSRSVATAFTLALAIVFLVLAAQFESFVSPLVILLTVPLGLAGAAFSLWVWGGSVNIFSQVGLVLLVGLMAKNGILLVEFINQLRDAGRARREAVIEGATIRLRPILMTTIATVLGALPLAVASGAGAESRSAIGLVICGGLSVALVLTLFLTPLIYDLIAQVTGARKAPRGDDPVVENPVAAE